MHFIKREKINLLFKKSIDKNINFLELTPRRKVDFEEIENEQIRLLVPRFKSEFAQKYLLPKWKSKFVPANLDNYGSACFRLIDSQKSVQKIADEMKKKFGEAIEPVYERVAKYLGHMHRLGMINFLELEKNN